MSLCAFYFDTSEDSRVVWDVVVDDFGEEDDNIITWHLEKFRFLHTFWVSYPVTSVRGFQFFPLSPLLVFLLHTSLKVIINWFYFPFHSILRHHIQVISNVLCPIHFLSFEVSSQLKPQIGHINKCCNSDKS